jgi:hypothetical protein
MRTTAVTAALVCALIACKSEEEKKIEAAEELMGKMASAATKALLGDKAPAETRDQIARAATEIAKKALQGMGDRLTERLAKLGTPGQAPSLPRASTQSPEEDAAAISKLDLGTRGDLFPSELKGLKLGMSAQTLASLRPNVRMGRAYEGKVKGQPGSRQVALEDAGPDSPYTKFSYHFENGELTAVFATLRVGSLTAALLEKAKAKWGPWRDDLFARKMEEVYSKRGGGMKEWRLPEGRVKLEKNSYDPQARLYFAR